LKQKIGVLVPAAHRFEMDSSLVVIETFWHFFDEFPDFVPCGSESSQDGFTVSADKRRVCERFVYNFRSGIEGGALPLYIIAQCNDIIEIYFAEVVDVL